jgi:lipopolysaccharide export LptBFGC system permease protein LptF
VLLALVAVGVYLPPRGARLAVVLAIGVSVVFWVIGQNFGKIFTGGATDPNSGPLLVVLGLAYWRRREVPGPASGSRAVLDPQGA